MERRKKLILITEDKTGQIKKSIQEFIKNRFGDSLTGFSFRISYNPKDHSLTITAENKVLANEITFLLADIHEYLRRSGITVGNILIR